MPNKKTIIIAGLGPAGLTAANFFAQDSDWTVRGYERLPEPTKETSHDSRGYGFTFSPRGLSCLPGELKKLVQSDCHPISERVFVYHDGSRKSFPYGLKDSDKLHALSRLDFLLRAKTKAQEAGAELRYLSDVTDVDPIAGEITYRANGPPQTDKGNLVLGADGAFSIIRARVSALSGASYCVMYDGVRFITVSLEEEEVNLLTQKNLVGLHFFISKKGTDVLIPTPPKGTLLIMSRLLPGIGRLTKHDAVAVASTRNVLVKDVVKGLAKRLENLPIGHFVSTEMERPYAERCVIVGDAWKAMPAYAGQGVNAAVQDVFDLVKMIDEYPTIDVALPHFSSHRRKQRTALNALNKNIGVQLLDGTYGGPEWRAKERFRIFLNRHLLHESWRSRYQRLAFDLDENP